MPIRPAQPQEGEVLTHIARAAKAHWGYDEAQLKSWEAELSYSPEYIRTHWVAVAESESNARGNEAVLGVCSLEAFGDQLEIAGLWVWPDAMGQGVGTALLNAAMEYCRRQQVTILRLLSDPNAQGFYTAMGAKLIGHERDSPNGRLLPLMHISVQSSQR